MNIVISELMLEFEFTFSFAIAEFVRSDFPLPSTIKYEYKPWVIV